MVKSARAGGCTVREGANTKIQCWREKNYEVKISVGLGLNYSFCDINDDVSESPSCGPPGSEAAKNS